MDTTEGARPGIGAVELRGVFPCKQCVRGRSFVGSLVVAARRVVDTGFSLLGGGVLWDRHRSTPALCVLVGVPSSSDTEVIRASSQVWYKERWRSGGVDAQRTSFQA